MIDFSQVKADAIERWPGIFQELGIDVGVGKHCPCPVCGGRDRFRMDNKEGRGTWFCNQCGAGDGWTLIQMVLGIPFKEALEQVAPIVGAVEPSAVREQSIDPKILRKMFEGSEVASKQNLVGGYLRNRGLSLVPSMLRYHKGIREPDTGKTMPAMLAVVTMPDGTAVTMHRTFLSLMGEKASIKNPKKLMPGLQKLNGAAIRLFEPKDKAIGVAEGIETAIACTELFNIPTWAVVSSTLMESFVPPVGIRFVLVCADNDENYTGQKAAYKLANRLMLKEGVRVEVEVPELTGDWLDILNDPERFGSSTA